MSQRFSRFFAGFLIAVSAVAMLSVSFDAEARRFGGGRSFGRQSSNIMKQRQAVKPPVANTTPRAATPAAGSRAAGTAAGSTARSGMSRWLGPIAGIAAGLGIASLLSALGLSGAFLEMMSSLLLIGLLVFGIMFIVRRLRGGAARPAMQGANPMQRQGSTPASWNAPSRPTPTSSGPTSVASGAAAPVATSSLSEPVDESWFIPEHFDTPGFLANAKAQFVKIQALWDTGDIEQLREYLTDDLVAEVAPEVEARGPGQTEIVLLNAELMGMEKLSDGHLASIRYSGMLRESANTEAFRFEEVWNLYKADNAGWLLAGIQQLPAGEQA